MFFPKEKRCDGTKTKEHETGSRAEPVAEPEFFSVLMLSSYATPTFHVNSYSRFHREVYESSGFPRKKRFGSSLKSFSHAEEQK
jgi:hypothetical protein